MSSSPLYLAIVVVWLIVLVPMLLRKDAAEPVHEDARRDDVEPDAHEDVEEDVEDDVEVPQEEDEDPDLTETQVIIRPGFHDEHTDEDVEAEAPRHVERSTRPSPEPRARVIARRRRRTSALTLLNIATIVAVAFGLGPWWVIAPPIVLLAGHLALLREAAKADAERRRAHLVARRRTVLRARRARDRYAREVEREAKVIALKERRSQVYDQYTDARLRAAGD
ncbi:hypothetical protein [Nocardiopsis sp. MG754419]|uniref:divisome protein SepX/GlpR n=1 Tax=Nocardiopsis sp. MG754419 TaxID=2259865 RepID=UPI001BAC78CB|nr:hypothetical protein [Nocardiopsis sp. MG754419]MBR8742318.1 hypothetical protein [Nocardiopsis sp. MG754419]